MKKKALELNDDLLTAPHSPSNTDKIINALVIAKERAEKIAALATTISGSIAHELRTPLTAIQLYTEILESSCASILATSASDSESSAYKNIHDCIKTIKHTIKNTNYLISGFLLQMQNVANGKLDKKDFTRYSISKNLRAVLEEYPFQTDERELIKIVQDGDFDYIGNPTFTNHLLFNLIKNALRAIKNADKGKITIELKTGAAFNELIFKDTALGISKDFLTKVFNQFESQMVSQGGTGIGLAFCKVVMQSYGGDIVCDSEEGEYTRFTLTFPHVPMQ